MITYLVSFGAGILATLSPCVLPVIPLVVGSSTTKSKYGPVFLTLGLVSSLVLMGLLFSSMTDLMGFTEERVRFGSAILLLAFGVTLLTPGLKDRFAELLQPVSQKSFGFAQRFDHQSSVGQFFVGALLGLAWSPCVGPTLGVAMTMAATESLRFEAGLVMMVFGVGMSAPLLGIAYGFKGFIQRNRSLLVRVNQQSSNILGFSTALIAVLILSGIDKQIESAVVSWLPNWYLRLSALL